MQNAGEDEEDDVRGGKKKREHSSQENVGGFYIHIRQLRKLAGLAGRKAFQGEYTEQGRRNETKQAKASMYTVTR